jgi:ArsR family transcriptional regulator, arsenate/arsenite/antimonite-responsive transcriptional repressor
MPFALTKEVFPLREGSAKRIARWFHALSDETRIQIIDRLSDGERCVCELTDLLDTGQSRLSFHLKTLKDAGLLTDRREGRWVYYSLNGAAVEEMEQFVRGLKACCCKLEESSVCCR